MLLFNCSVMSDSLLPHGLQHDRLLVFHYLPEFAQTHVHLVNIAIQPSHLLSPFSCLQSFPSIRSFLMNQLFASGGQSIRLSFSISPSNEYSGLISFRINSFNLLAVQGVFKSLLQHHNSKHQFFSAQPSLWSSSHIRT